MPSADAVWLSFLAKFKGRRLLLKDAAKIAEVNDEKRMALPPGIEPGFSE
jgi:hypothetical protein